MGKRRDEPIRVSTVDFFLWLLNYEFPDTVLVISKKSAIFATSQKKSKSTKLLFTFK
jgi:nucleosome binding factor SPN SPT16 subunit